MKVLLYRAELLLCSSKAGLGWLQCCAVTTDWLADWLAGDIMARDRDISDSREDSMDRQAKKQKRKRSRSREERRHRRRRSRERHRRWCCETLVLRQSL